jgi:serine/threonine-protein kinase
VTPDPEPFIADDDFEEPALAAVADAILDGAPIDWTPMDSSASNDPALARQLRVLAGMAALHRTPGPSWGHLQIIEKVGQGAFGEVFRAWDPHLNRDVALKLLGPATSPGSDNRSWVLAEARFLASVRHANVVTVHGADRIDGRVGFWTEFIRGRTLAELVHEQGIMGAEDAAAVGVDVCRAVSAVHAAGLLHRDIKANNVMREEGGRTVLLDFGATKNFVQQAIADGLIGDPHGPTGTPLYVAPELWRNGAATPQSDIYSVGVLLYFLVTGSYPVRGETVRDVGDAHRAGQRARLRDARADLPDAFIDIVEKAIDPEPSRRFDTVDALESALTRFRAPVDESSRRITLWKDRRVLVAAGIAVSVLGYAAFATRGGGASAIDRPQHTTRRISLAPNLRLGPPSKDGQFMTYVSNSTGDVGILEVATGNMRVVAPGRGSEGSGVTWLDRSGDSGPRFNAPWALAVLSPGNDRVAYTWSLSQETFELRVASEDGKSHRTLLPRQSEYEPVPVQWSPDGREILCWFLHRNEEAALVMVSPADGSIRRLYHKKGGLPSTALSPDGRFVTFTHLLDGKRRNDLLIIGTDGSESRLLSLEPALSPAWIDDTHLFFLRPPEDAGSKDGWIVQVVDGAVQGQPVRAMPNLGNISAATAAGQGFVSYLKEVTRPDVFEMSIDLQGRVPPGKPVSISQPDAGHHLAPSYSPDGRSIAYFSTQPSQTPDQEGSLALTIHDVASRKNRTMATELAFLERDSPQWLPDGQRVLVLGGDQPGKERLGYYEVDVRTGQTRAMLFGRKPMARLLPDGTGLLYLDEKRGIVARKFATGEEVTVVPGPTPKWGRFSLSPDGTMCAFSYTVTREAGAFSTDILGVQTLNGPMHELARVNYPEYPEFQAWTADSGHVLYTRRRVGAGAAPAPQRLWVSPTTGGRPRDLQLDLPDVPISVSPDGRSIVFQGRVTGQELWIQPLPPR